MIKGELTALILRNFPHNPTTGQQKVAEMLGDFIASSRNDEGFLLSGYAGTGKTSLVGALVKTLRRLHIPSVLLAPTGRAAKVFSLYSSSPAYTIHRKIYRQKEFSPEANNFVQGYNHSRNTLFIVDEASMIANDGLSGGLFGTGRLLDDLVEYVYSGPGCRLMLIGDEAQLPPVGERLSPALSVEALEGYGLHIHHYTLTEVVRQLEESGILWNATALRNTIDHGDWTQFPRLHIGGFSDIRMMPGNELIEALEESYYHCGKDQTIVVTRSNKTANIYNKGIRGRILDYEEELVQGDQLIIAKNNYYWTELNEERMPFIANGDLAVVMRVRNEREFYGFRFTDATLRFPDYDDEEMDVTLLLDTLHAEAPALTYEQQQTLFKNVCADYPEIKNRKKLYERVKNDPYYNALQVKYAYAVTCHKAQGGQWQHVYIDQGYMTEAMLSPDYFRWLYTALTRSTEKVFLVNWPKNQLQ